MDRKPNMREKVTLDDLAREILSSELHMACNKVKLKRPLIYIRVTRVVKFTKVIPLAYSDDKLRDPIGDNHNKAL